MSETRLHLSEADQDALSDAVSNGNAAALRVIDGILTRERDRLSDADYLALLEKLHGSHVLLLAVNATMVLGACYGWAGVGDHGAVYSFASRVYERAVKDMANLNDPRLMN